MKEVREGSVADPVALALAHEVAQYLDEVERRIRRRIPRTPRVWVLTLAMLHRERFAAAAADATVRHDAIALLIPAGDR